MVENIEGLAGFTKRNRRSCEIQNFGTTVLAKTVAAKLKKQQQQQQQNSTFCTVWDKLTCTQLISVLKYGCTSIPIIPQLHSEQNQHYDAR